MVTEKVEFNPLELTKGKEQYLQKRLKQLEMAKEQTQMQLSDFQQQNSLVI
jgi:hypothetical protein